MTHSNIATLYPQHETSIAAAPAQALRLTAIDLQRGLIMIIMAFSHCREYVGVPYYENNHWRTSSAWLSNAFVDLFEQIFVSTVASGFFMLMGIGIILLYQARLREGWSIEKICAYLIKRGAVLVLIQLSILQIFEIVAEHRIYFYAGVLMTLGLCMILSAICLFCLYKIKKFFSLKSNLVEYLFFSTAIIGIIAALQCLVSGLITSQAHPTLWENILVIGPKSLTVDIDFTPIPWFPAVAFGLIIGFWLRQYRDKTFNIIGLLAFSFLSAWILLRTANVTGLFSLGSYKLAPPSDAITIAAYFSVSKYPPSLVYFLWTLGFNLLGLYLFNKLDWHSPKLTRLLQPINLFGQCALFFYVLHWFVYYGYSLLLENKFRTGGSLACMWLLGLFTLYPLCKAYRDFKLKQTKESLWRMF